MLIFQYQEFARQPPSLGRAPAINNNLSVVLSTRFLIRGSGSLQAHVT